MEWKTYLRDTFLFNDQANRKMLEKIKQLPDPSEPIRYISHLINSQDKWLKRIEMYPKDPGLDWWEPKYPFEELAERWERSLQDWIRFLENKTDDELTAQLKFVGFDGAHWASTIKDIALQLNYHS